MFLGLLFLALKLTLVVDQCLIWGHISILIVFKFAVMVVVTVAAVAVVTPQPQHKWSWWSHTQHLSLTTLAIALRISLPIHKLSSGSCSYHLKWLSFHTFPHWLQVPECIMVLHIWCGMPVNQCARGITVLPLLWRHWKQTWYRCLYLFFRVEICTVLYYSQREVFCLVQVIRTHRRK